MLSLVSTQAATSTLPRCAPDLGFGYVNGEFWYCSKFISNYAQAGKNACESDLQHDVSWFATEWVDIVLLTDPDLKEFSYDPPDSVVDGTMRAVTLCSNSHRVREPKVSAYRLFRSFSSS